MTSEGLGKMFEGDFADMWVDNFPLVSMGEMADGLECAEPSAVQWVISAQDNKRHHIYGIHRIKLR